uniref:Uncharacterized protein n=1 Tax=Ciona intestinalis TaxID=7719 RepID=H2Y3T8_CIOIN
MLFYDIHFSRLTVSPARSSLASLMTLLLPESLNRLIPDSLSLLDCTVPSSIDSLCSF